MMQISLMFKLVTWILQTEQQQSTWFESASYIATILTTDNWPFCPTNLGLAKISPVWLYPFLY